MGQPQRLGAAAVEGRASPAPLRQVALADTITTRWMSAVQRVFLQTGRLPEKYDAQQDRPGGGGEYPTQDGFGWTSGTFVAMGGLGV